MRDPVVLTDAVAAAELARLCGELWEARERAGVSTRAAAAVGGVNLGTLWRVERARSRPTFQVLARLAEVAGVTLEIDDGRPVSRQPASQEWPLPPGYRLEPVIVQDAWEPAKRRLHQRMHHVRVRLGAELWWARHAELADPMDAETVCRLLGMSHHTLSRVEFGPSWPDLASIVRVAGLTGRRVVLAPVDGGLRVPAWTSAAQ